MVLHEIQSFANDPAYNFSANETIAYFAMSPGTGSFTDSSANIAMERGETSNGNVSAETIAYLAAETSINDTITANGGGSILIKTMTTANNIQGYDNGCFNNSYNGGAFTTTPYVLAQQVSRNGGDGGWLRRYNINSSQIGLTVDEDRAADTERSHTSETAAVFAFENAFEWCPPQLNLAKNSMLLRDPVNGTSSPKAIPGSLQSYDLRLKNEGRIPLDNNKVTLTDTIPANTSIFVQSSINYPEPPITFTDGAGAAASGLTFVYSGPASTTDDVEFSMDNGSNFNYLPTPDSDGFDDAVTDVRINPKGIFNASNGTDIPSFTVTFSVRVD